MGTVAGKHDPRVDAYIAKAAPFARPILERLRAAVHQACPDATETIKWSMPFFDRGGRPLAHMAAFKAHCAFGFWKAPGSVDTGKEGEAMGQFGRIESLADLPTMRPLVELVKEAARVVEAHAKAPKVPKPAAKKPAPEAPEDLLAALKDVDAARQTFEGFAPGKQREYVDWILEAKQEATRARRIQQAVAWLAEGKSRHWKYQDC